MKESPEPVGSGDSDVLGHHMAVPVGFEPTVRFHAHNFSRVAPSAARTRHRGIGYYIWATGETETICGAL